LLFALACTAASALAINPYRYGLADHYLMIPFLKQWMDPSLYPGDFVVAERIHLYTVFWPALALVAKLRAIDLSTLFFACYAACLYATFVAIGCLARASHASIATALLAMFVLVFPKPGLAGSWTIENSLLTRVVALPIVLFAFTSLLRMCYVAAFALLGCAFLIHPLTAAYALAMVALVSAIELLISRPSQLLLGLGVFALIASPIVVWSAAYGPDSLGGIVAEAQWLDLLRRRSPNHIAPTTWGIDDYVVMGLAFVVLLAGTRGRPLPRGSRVFVCFAAAIVALCAAGYAFTEWLPLTTIVQFQLFRSSVFVVYFAAILYAHRVDGAVARTSTVDVLAVELLVGAALLLGADGWPFAVAAIAIVLVAGAAHAAVRGPIGVPLLAVLLSGVLAMLAGGAALQGKRIKVANGQPSAWLDVQRWASASTARDALFIVPPGELGFRVESERAIYADWKDGTQAFFDADVGDEWLRRMRRLGYRDELPLDPSSLDDLDAAFAALGSDELRSIAEEAGAGGRPVYLVTYAGRQHDLKPIYENGKFAVYPLSASAGAAPAAARP
jgi:hypothetical protein